MKGQQKGVTLIELLVVITIMMTMMSLVAPIAINTVERAEAQDEYLSFASSIRRASIKAFANGSGININLNNNQITVVKSLPNHFTGEDVQQAEIIFQKEYKHLFFNDVGLKLNRNGIPNITQLTLIQRNKTRQLDLIRLLEH